MLRGKRILIGITGSIAAYKAAILVRNLIREGAEVKVVMTELAKQFITPLTMATLSKNPILVDFFDPEDGRWNSHVSLGEWADAYVIAPATANTMAKMAAGVADNLLLTTYLSARCPVFVAPAMDLDMYAHRATGRNIETLRRDGVLIVNPGDGELASGLVGKGRMAEPEEITDFLREYFQHSGPESQSRDSATGSGAPTGQGAGETGCGAEGSSGAGVPGFGRAVGESTGVRGCRAESGLRDSIQGIDTAVGQGAGAADRGPGSGSQDSLPGSGTAPGDGATDCGAEKKKSLKGFKFLVTAGPTVEAIDPVRFISNHSTGKMGYAIAGRMAREGAHVVLVSGPVAIDAPRGVELVPVTTAEQMCRAAREAFASADGAVLCAAVADYTPADYSPRKIKKREGDLTIPLRKTEDIAAILGREKQGRVIVGFALETDNELENARAKLERKNMDMIVLNSLSDEGAGFGGDTNVITILDRDGGQEQYPLMSKDDAARIIVDKLGRRVAGSVKKS